MPDAIGEGTPDTLPSRMGLWVLSGQSNMEGYGILEGPRASATPDAWVFSSSGIWEQAQDPLHRLWESPDPVNRRLLRANLPADHPYRGMSDDEVAHRERTDRVVGAGLGMEFASARIRDTERAIGLVPAAQGATSLDEWWPDSSRDEGDTLYSAMLRRVRRASAVDGAVVDGLLWYQGESDATPERAETYEHRLREWIRRVRSDLHRDNLPILLVQLGRVVPIPPILDAGLDPTAWTRVREAHRRIGDSVPGVRVTSAIDLDLTDEIHVDTAGLRRIGRRLARLAAGEASPALESVVTGPRLPDGRPTVLARFDGVHGGWANRSRITGFVVTDAEGHPSTQQQILGADATDARGTIRFVLNQLDDGLHLAYGLGFDPPAVLRDARDMPLPAFAPQLIASIGERRL